MTFVENFNFEYEVVIRTTKLNLFYDYIWVQINHKTP